MSQENQRKRDQDEFSDKKKSFRHSEQTNSEIKIGEDENWKQ
jgi:hypothetical protein